MPTPTTVLQFATQERDAQQALHHRATTELASADALLTQVSRTLSADAAGYALLERDIANRRALLATTAVPADANALVAELTALVIEQRALQAKLLDGEAAVAAERARVAVATAATQRAAGRLAAAEAALAREQTAAERRLEWQAALGQPPLNTLPAAAAAAIGDARFAAAQTVVGELPVRIGETAVSRYDLHAARLAAARAAVETAEDLLAGEYGANGGGDGMVEQRRIEFARAVGRLRDFATRAADRFALALALLDRTAAEPLLSAAEQARITATDLATDGAAAATLGITRDTAQRTLDQQRAFLEDVTLAEQVAQPDADVSTVTAVSDAQDDVDAATTARDTAETAFAADSADLAAWLAVVPDGAWRRVRAFHDAVAILDELSGVDAAQLVTDLDTAEQQYAAALDTAAQRRRAVALLRDAVALRTARLTATAAARETRALSAVRGDS
jgi:hypothetical protein